ncbi:hypothetical protein C8A01DRAFT_34908 [Parachaetomium inaequale]|uniref:2EXR domain-containing protein n=1 Tax=Parachaetomium inaequale TaxID=2588326 RepID=A0AAN6PHF8_9PEZI|nr:hypothetical protein C8A01DRAFT_34908 [Parachaetomium inaequale]
MAPAFTVFNGLPLELRQLIWHAALPDDEPEVLVPRAAHLDLRGRDTPLEPMTVDTAFPTLMHTCRESRDYVRHHSGLRFRASPKGHCDVPFRLFRPDLDTVFWDEDQHHCLWAPFYTAGHDRWLSQLRHLAVPSATAFIGQHTTDCIMQHCPQLRSLSVVFPDSADYNWVQTRFAEPERRRKLRRIPPTHAQRIKVVFDAWHYDPEHRITLHDLLMLFCDELNQHGENIGGPHEDCAGQAWTIQSESESNLHCFAQTFVEWRRGEWVEVCANRRLPRT